MKHKGIIKVGFIAICVLFVNFTFAQNQLSKAEAVKILLENNYGIKVAKNSRQIAENNTSKENNGYLPTVTATAGSSANLGGSSQTFNSGMEANVRNAFTWGANASIGANYTLINKQRDATLEQLKELVSLSDYEVRQTVEQNLVQLFNAYYEIARLTENLAVLEETISLSRQRLLRAQYRYDYGQGIRLDVLNAQVDIQRDSINYLNSKQLLANSKRNLNFVIGRAVNVDFTVDTLVTYANDLTLEGLLADVEKKNVAVLISDKNQQLNEYDLKIIEAGKKPVLGSSASYDFNYQNNAREAFITASNSQGLAVGVNLSWSIFDGGLRKVRKQNTLVAIQNQRVIREQTLQQLERDITNLWESYQNALFVLKVEKNSLAINRLNFGRTQELFKSGQVTSVEFRQAQLNLLNASTSYNTAKYNAKAIEIQLYQLGGTVLDQEF